MNDIGIDHGLVISYTGITLYKTDMLEGNEVITVDNSWFCSSDMSIVLGEVMLAKLEDLPIYLVSDSSVIRHFAKNRWDELNGRV
jgi:hypothetical protein